jgi:hypothetical protein
LCGNRIVFHDRRKKIEIHLKILMSWQLYEVK